MSQDTAKRAAALKALELVESGMALGLGTGSTADCFTDGLGERVREGLAVRCVPTSERTERRAAALGIPLIALGDAEGLDLVVDGADEIDAAGCLIKGGGGALLREKLVAQDGRRVVIIADESKLVQPLGKFPLPIEIVAFGARRTLARLRALFKSVPLEAIKIRVDSFGEPFVTDGGNLIVDAGLGAIEDPPKLAATLKAISGVVDHGLFIGLTDLVILGRADGSTRTRAPETS